MRKFWIRLEIYIINDSQFKLTGSETVIHTHLSDFQLLPL